MVVNSPGRARALRGDVVSRDMDRYDFRSCGFFKDSPAYMSPFDTACTVKLGIRDEELLAFFGFDACFPSYSGGSLAPRVIG